MIRRTGAETRLARWSRRKAEARADAGPGAPKAGRGAAAPREVPGVSTVPGAEGPAMPWAPPLTGGAAAPEPAAAGAENAVTEADREKAAEMGLPDIEKLGPGSDFRPFMREGVPAVLKRLALRKLWVSNPAFGVLDGLNDYDENFRVTNVLIDAAETAYKAGKGYFTAEDGDEDQTEDEAGDETETGDAAEEKTGPSGETAESEDAAAEDEGEGKG